MHCADPRALTCSLRVRGLATRVLQCVACDVSVESGGHVARWWESRGVGGDSIQIHPTFRKRQRVC